MPERDLVQLTLSPEEAVWLFAVANTSHLLAGAIGAGAAGEIADRAELMKLARRQVMEIFVAGDCIEPHVVLDRLETLIKNTTRAVIFTDET